MIPALLAIIGGSAIMILGQRGALGSWWSRFNITGGDMTKAGQLITAARAELGKRYQSTPEQGPDFWDCSGLIQQAHKVIGINLPRQITEQAQDCPGGAIDARDEYMTIDQMKAALRPGDCIGTGFQANGRYKHGGIWTGNSVIHASASRGKVVEDPGLGSYWFTERRGIYRWI